MYLTGTYNLLLLLKTHICIYIPTPPTSYTHCTLHHLFSLSLTHLTRTNIPCSRPPKHTNAPHTPHQYKHIHTCTSPITYTPPIHIHPPHPSHTHTQTSHTHLILHTDTSQHPHAHPTHPTPYTPFFHAHPTPHCPFSHAHPTPSQANASQAHLNRTHALVHACMHTRTNTDQTITVSSTLAVCLSCALGWPHPRRWCAWSCLPPGSGCRRWAENDNDA